MYAPVQHDEVTGLVNYVDEQLATIRAAAFGLTEEQARETPCRSALSVGGIIKHAVYVMRGALERLRTEVTGQPVDAVVYAAFTDSFADDETVAGTIEDFDRVRVQLRAVVAATDPAGSTTAPPAPWHGIFDARLIHARYYLVHLVEECARHAGHADIIREQQSDVDPDEHADRASSSMGASDPVRAQVGDPSAGSRDDGEARGVHGARPPRRPPAARRAAGSRARRRRR